jgi:hypothetical protein
MRCTDRSHECVIAIGTRENRSHRRRIQMQRAYRSGGAAGVTLNLCRRYLKSEHFLKETCCSIAIQNEIRAILSHGINLSSRRSEAFRLYSEGVMSSFYQEH